MGSDKYRAKRMDNGKWVYGSLIKYNNPFVEGGVRAFIVPFNIDPGIVKLTGNNRIEILAYHVDPKTIGQFTGQHDENKIDIYKSDIVTDYLGDILVVIGGPRIYLDLIKKATHVYPARYLDCDYMNWKVIGNLFDNPELLKEATL